MPTMHAGRRARAAGCGVDRRALGARAPRTPGRASRPAQGCTLTSAEGRRRAQSTRGEGQRAEPERAGMVRVGRARGTKRQGMSGGPGVPGAMGKAGKRRRAGGAVVGEEPEPRGEAGRQARPRERAWAGGLGRADLGGARGGRPRGREGRTVDASVPWAEEGRGKLRKASGSRTQALIRGCPNGGTRRDGVPSPSAEHIGGAEAQRGN